MFPRKGGGSLGTLGVVFVFVGLVVAGWAEEGEVVYVGGAAVLPGLFVVDFAVCGAYAARGAVLVAFV